MSRSGSSCGAFRPVRSGKKHEQVARRAPSCFAHALDKLGISPITAARPVQAALISALTFAVGAALPLTMVLVSPAPYLAPAMSVASLLFLASLGAIGAWAGGANVIKASARVTFRGALAMAATAGIGALVGTAA